MGILNAYVKFVDWLNEKIGYLTAWLASVLVVVMCYDVFTRYVLNNSKVAVQEMEWHIFSIMFLMGAAYTLKRDKHVRVDVFYMKCSEKVRAWIDLLGNLIFLIPYSMLVIYTSTNFVRFSWMSKEGSPDPGGLPGRYVLKAFITVGFILVVLQGFSQAFKAFFVIINKPYEKE